MASPTAPQLCTWPAVLMMNCPQPAVSVLHCQGPWPHRPPTAGIIHIISFKLQKCTRGSTQPGWRDIFLEQDWFLRRRREPLPQMPAPSSLTALSFHQFLSSVIKWGVIAHIFADCVEAVLCCLVEAVLCWWSCAEELFVGCVEAQPCWKRTRVSSTPVFHLPILIKLFTRSDLPSKGF